MPSLAHIAKYFGTAVVTQNTRPIWVDDGLVPSHYLDCQDFLDHKGYEYNHGLNVRSESGRQGQPKLNGLLYEECYMNGRPYKKSLKVYMISK